MKPRERTLPSYSERSLYRLARNEAGIRNVSKELTKFDPASCLSFDGNGKLLPNASGCNQRIGSPVNNCDSVARFRSLDTPVTVKALDSKADGGDHGRQTAHKPQVVNKRLFETLYARTYWIIWVV